MTSTVAERPSQLVLPTFLEVVDTNGLYGFDPDRRITLGRLARIAGQGVDVHPEPSVSDHQNAEPAVINSGLYIPPRDVRYSTAQQLVRLGVSRDSLDTTHRNMAVVFPASEFHVVARNAKDFANHIAATTRNANQYMEDRDEVTEKAGRSVAHALTSKLGSLTALAGRLESERKVLKSLYRDTGSSWQAHYKIKNLEPLRKFADERIHETAEVSAITLNHGTTAVKGIHRVIKKRLYSSSQSTAEIGHNWHKYITMVGMYTSARIHKIGLSKEMCEDELLRHSHFLQPNEPKV